METKKETDASEYAKALVCYNEVVICSCSLVERVVFVEFKMDVIRQKSMSFLSPIVIAMEYVKKGSRLFLSTSFDHFPHYFMQIRSDPRYCEELVWKTWDEILLSDRPIRLYLDLDMYLTPNSDVNPMDKAGNIWKELLNHLKEAFPSSNPELVVLEATTDKKFSQHWFVHGLPNFEDSQDVGKFVWGFVGKFLASSDPELLKIKSENGKTWSKIVDTSVYSRGANFRVLGSPKFGRDNVLKYRSKVEGFESLLNSHTEHDFQFHRDCKSCEQILMASLATVKSTSDVNFWQKFSQIVPTEQKQQFLEPDKKPVLYPTFSEKLELYNGLDAVFSVVNFVEKNETLKSCFVIFNLLKKLLKDYKVVLLNSQEAVESNAELYKLLSEKIYLWKKEFEGFISKSPEFSEENASKMQFLTAEIMTKLEKLKSLGEKHEKEKQIESKDHCKVPDKCSKRLRHTLGILQKLVDDRVAGEEAANFFERYTSLISTLPFGVRENFPETLDSDDILANLLSQLKLDSEQIRNQRRENGKSEILNLMRMHLTFIGSQAEIYCILAGNSNRGKNQATRFMDSSARSVEELMEIHKAIGISEVLETLHETEKVKLKENLANWKRFLTENEKIENKFLIQIIIALMK